MSRVEEFKIMAAKKAIKQKPFSQELNLADISIKVYDIMEACGDVRWMDDQLDDLLGEEWADNYRLQFSNLGNACERFVAELDDYKHQWTMEGDDRGDCWFDAMVASAGGNGGTLAWYEYADAEDYTPLWGYTQECAVNMARTRITRLTKDKMVELIGDSMWILRNYYSIQSRYSTLSGVYELLKEECGEELEVVKGIEDAWAQWDAERNEDTERELRRVCEWLPDKVWLM